MSLEELLKPVKYVDEQMLRGYTTISNKFEEKGENKYVLAAWASASSFFSFGIYQFGYKLIEIMNGTSEEASFSSLVGATAVGFLLGVDFTRLIEEFKYQNISKTTGTKVKSPPGLEIYRKITAAVRLPLLVAGAYALGLSCKESIESLISWSSEPLTLDTLKNTLLGFGAASLASSIYIKDTDPKLLDKPPFYKAAYEWMKEKLTPAPQSITAYSTLEDKI